MAYDSDCATAVKWLMIIDIMLMIMNMLMVRSVYLIRMWKTRQQASSSARKNYGIEITVARWRGSRRFFMIRNFRTYLVHRSQTHSPQTFSSLFTSENSIFVDRRGKISFCKSVSWMVGYGLCRIATSCTPMRDIGQLLQFLCIISYVLDSSIYLKLTVFWMQIFQLISVK